MMPLQSYYGGYSLVRTSNAANGSIDANVNKPLASATANATTASPSSSSPAPATGFAWMNLAALNSDWMPSLANSAAAETRRTVAPIDPVAPSALGENAARTSILRSLIGMQSFYRGAPLRTATHAVSKGSGACAAKTTAAPIPTATTFAATAQAAAAGSVCEAVLATTAAAEERVEVKKKIPCVPTPIGSETWAALSGTALTAQTSVVATRHKVVRPVAPKAIDGDEVFEKSEVENSLRNGPEPLFCDLLQLDAVPGAIFKNNGITKKRQMPAPVGELLYSRQPVPPEPIMPTSMLSVDDTVEKRQSKEEEEQQQPQAAQQQQVQNEMCYVLPQRSESPMSLSEEGQFLSQALLDEVNTGGSPLPELPIEKPQQSAPPLYNNSCVIGGGLLRESDGAFGLFDGDDDETLENLKRVINLVMSANVADVPPKAKKDTEFNMEWAKTAQPDSLFFQ